MADYNINAVTRRAVFDGSSGLGPYAFSFEVLDQNDVAVYFNTTLLTLTTDYTVVVNANGTGSVTIVTGSGVPSTPTASDTIIIIGARDIERVTDFVTAGDLLASSLNEQLDALTIFDQQLAEEGQRSMRAPVYDPALVADGGTLDMTLPPKADRIDTVMAFDSDGNPVKGPTVSGITTITALAADITTLADIEDGTVATDAISDAAAIASDISTVSGIAANVTTTAGNTSNINTVAGNTTNINTVASIDSDVTTVAGISSNVTTAAGISADITAVAADATDIGTVSASIANVNTVAGISADVSTVAADGTDIGVVAGISSDVTTVSGISANVTTVAGNTSNINAVAADATDIGTVATSIANVNTVAGIDTDVTTVAGIAADVTAAATNASDISAIAAEVAKVVTVANDLNEAVSEIDTVANSIANVDLVGASITDVNTVASNLSGITAFADVYASGPTDPTTNLNEGDLFFNTTSDTLKVYTGSAWESGVTAGSGFLPLAGGQLTGNLTFSATQTVDGRDVSVDGTKLDGIEAGATADQTGAEIKSAYEAEADTNAFTDAEKTKLTGIETGADVTDATNVAAAGALMTTGGSVTGDIDFGQNNKALFGGVGGDLEIYHNGTNAFIDNNDGVLYIRNNVDGDDGSDIYIQAKSGENGIIVQDDGEVQLYYNGVIKLNTSNTGITVVGTVAATSYTGDGSSLTGISAGALAVEYLIVAGGAGAGNVGNGLNGGGGGGAGAVIHGTTLIKSGTTYTVTVGAGGAASSTGNDSVFGVTIAKGGGEGADLSNYGGDGGSGGGSSTTNANGLQFGQSGQHGSNGGWARMSSTYQGGGRGGGAVEAGQSRVNGVNGAGGDGLRTLITGTATYFGGGGGGGIDTRYGGTQGAGGLGGGGAAVASATGTAGTVNTGGGGGSGNTTGGAGGSGVVILRVLTSQYSGTSTGSPTITTDGDYTILKFTSSGSYTG